MKIDFEKILRKTTDSFKDEDGNECWRKWQIDDLMRDVWNKAIDMATKEATTELTSTCIRIDKNSILKLKV